MKKAFFSFVSALLLCIAIVSCGQRPSETRQAGRSPIPPCSGSQDESGRPIPIDSIPSGLFHLISDRDSQDEQGTLPGTEPSLIGSGTRPSIHIITPERLSRYAEHVVVRGTVGESPSGQESGGAGAITSLEWEILGTDHHAEIRFDQEGYFEFAIPTLGLPPMFYLRIVAADNQGRIAERLVTLIAENAAPAEPVAQVEPIAPTEPVATVAPAEEDRGEAPLLTLNLPRQDDYFSPGMRISGRVRYPEGGLTSTPPIESLSWTVEGSPLRGELEIDESGKFDEVVDTAMLRRDAALIVRAVDHDGQVVERSVRLRADTCAPKLEILSPRSGEFYEDAVTVQGRIRDDQASSLTWEIIGVSGLVGAADLSEDGEFGFHIDTTSLVGAQILELLARDAVGNTTAIMITLRPAAPPEEVPQTVSTQPEVLQPKFPSVSAAKPALGTSEIVKPSPAITEAARPAPSDTVVAPAESAAPTTRKQAAAVEAASAETASSTTAGAAPAALAPELLIDSPADRAYYRSSVDVVGRVVNGNTLVWEIAGSGLGDTIVVGTEGTFAFQIPTADLHGTQLLRLVGRAEGKFTQGESTPGESTPERTVILLDGNINPSLVIASPRVNQLYGAQVRVSGSIIDPYADSAEMGGIESVSYDVSSPEVFALVKSVPQGEVELREDNSFDFVLNTCELSGPQDINILVRARSGIQTKSSVRILQGEADIPSFTVVAGDRRATLRWDSLPAAAGYSLSYRAVNPGQGEGRTVRLEGVSSPYVLTGLANGERYHFQVHARVPGEADSRSAEKWAIPLSAETLRPLVLGEFEQIRVSWPSIPGTNAYTLWRSASRDGEYEKLTAELRESNYVDTAVQYGRSYFYRVTPASATGILSDPVMGESMAFPVEKLESAGICSLNQARRVTLYGGYAFVADGREGIKIVDISTPETPALVGGLQTDEARDIAVQGELAFVADGPRGLKVLDISDPRSPIEIGMRKTMDARSIAVDAEVAFIADGSSGLKIIDVTSPVQPARIGSYATEYAADLLLHDRRLFLADGTGGLRIFDISDTVGLLQIGALPAVDARSLAAKGSTLYLAAGAQGLVIVDISNPEEPAELGRFGSSEALDVDVGGSFAYLADAREGMIVVDVSDPLRPRRFADIQAEKTTSIVVRDRYAYLATSSGLQVVRLLIQGRSVPKATCSTGGKAYALAVSGRYAYVACHDQGVRVLDISDPSRLSEGSLVGSWASDYATDIEIVASVAYVANGRRGLSMVDLSLPWSRDPGSQRGQIGSFYTGGTAHRLAAQEGSLFVADGREGLKILDVSLPYDPVEIGSLPTQDARDVAAVPGYALLADNESGLIVCDISDPSNPVQVDTFGSGGAHRIVVQDNLALVAGRSGVELFNVSDPRKPIMLSRFESPYVEGIDIRAVHLYIAEGYRGLKVLDIRSADHPIVVSACPEIYAVDVAACGGYALVADSQMIQAIEVLIPEWLSQASSGR